MSIILIDKEAFKTEVNKYLDLSPIWKEYQDVRNLSYPSSLIPPKIWETLTQIRELISVSCSAIEIAKQRLISQHDPDGSKGLKFSPSLALETAVEIVGAGIKFSGFFGPLVNRLWKPFLGILVSMWVSGQPVSWVQIALQILQIALPKN